MPPSSPATTDPDAQRAAFRRVFPGVMVAMFLAATDQTILAAAIPAIAGDLGHFADVSWLAAAYLMAATIIAPIYGHLGDRFGRKRILYTALALFVVASLACALAPTFGTLIAARALQGLGGGGLMTTSQALIGEQVPPRERGRYQGYFASLFALSSTAGPVLGGYLTQHFSWRSVFLVNLPLGLAAALLARRVHATRPHLDAPFRADVVGAMLFTLAAGTLLFALSSAGHRLGWGSATLHGLLALAVAQVVLREAWERRVDDPLIPVRLLAKPAILRTNAMVFTFAASLFGVVLYLPLYLQLGRESGVGESGFLLLPITLTIAATAAYTGRAITVSGRLTVFPKFGLALSTLAFAALALWLGALPTWTVMALIVLGAGGLGTVMPTAQVLIQDEAGLAALGSATASISVSRSLGGAFGSALVGGLLVLAVGANDPAVNDALARIAESGGKAGTALSPSDLHAIAVRLNDAYRFVFAALAALTASGLALATTIPRRAF